MLDTSCISCVSCKIKNFKFRSITLKKTMHQQKSV